MRGRGLWRWDLSALATKNEAVCVFASWVSVLVVDVDVFVLFVAMRFALVTFIVVCSCCS